jgi:hypothetical protein
LSIPGPHPASFPLHAAAPLPFVGPDYSPRRVARIWSVPGIYIVKRLPVIWRTAKDGQVQDDRDASHTVHEPGKNFATVPLRPMGNARVRCNRREVESRGRERSWLFLLVIPRYR